MLDKVQKKSKVCTVPVCDRIIWSMGYCPAHYRKYRLYGYVPNIPVMKIRPRGSERPQCSLDGCERLVHARKLCHTHYAYAIRKGTLNDN